MTVYLHLQCGAYPLLVAIRHVVEIGARSATADHSARRQWRDRTLPVVNLATLLGSNGDAACEQVVLSRDGIAIAIVDVSRVLGIQELPDQAFADFAGVTTELAALVDGIWPSQQHRHGCALRLRYPFHWLEPAPATEHSRSES